MLRAFWESAAAVDADRARPHMEQHTMRFSSPDELRALWRSAGLGAVSVAPIDVEAAYADFEDLWAPFPTGVGPAGAYAAALGPGEQEALRAELARQLGDPDGPFTLSARAWVAVGNP